MFLTGKGRAIAATLILGGALMVPAMPADATTTGPTVIAVHRNGAVDVSGNSTFGNIAKLSVPAGNWLITATATVQATENVLATYCDLVAGNDSYSDRTDPTNTGVGSLGAMKLLLAHHFAKSGSVTLKCENSDWTGDVLIRDVHVTAVEVGALTSGDVTYGSGSPVAMYGQNGTTRLYFDTAVHDVQDMSLPAGTWLVQGAGWGLGNTDGDRVDCSLASSSATADSFVEDFADIAGRSIGVEGVVTLSGPDTVFIYCKDTDANWSVRGSAISALKVGTLKYGHFGSASTTTGSGSPTVVGAYSDDVGPVSTSTSLQSIASVSLPAGGWFVTSKLSLFADGYAVTTCQLGLGGRSDQGRVILDGGTNSINWLGMSLTRKLSASSNASLACNQSDSTTHVLYLHDKIFGIKAGTLTDTLLE